MGLEASGRPSTVGNQTTAASVGASFTAESSVAAASTADKASAPAAYGKGDTLRAFVAGLPRRLAGAAAASAGCSPQSRRRPLRIPACRIIMWVNLSLHGRSVVLAGQ